MPRLGLGLSLKKINVVNFILGIISALQSRTEADGGTFEAPNCGISALQGYQNLGLYSKAEFILTGNGYKSGSIYTVLPNNGTKDLAFIRTASGSRFNNTGYIEFDAPGIPRLDYSAGTCPGWLFESSRTNNILYSNTFDNADWTIGNTTITSSNIISPDSTLNGWKVNEDNANSSHRVYKNSNVNTTLNQRNVFSVFVRPAERTAIAFETNLEAGGFVYTTFNLIGTGSVISRPANYSASIVLYDNGWYRVSTSAVSNATGTKYFGINILSGSSYSTTYTGIPNNGLYIYGAQLEAGTAGATLLNSYIPTTNATVTKGGENPVLIPTSSNLNSFTVFYAGTHNGNQANDFNIRINSGSGDANYIGWYRNGGTISNTNNAGAAVNVSNLLSTGSENKFALSYTNATASWYSNGRKIHSSSVFSASSWSTWTFGGNSTPIVNPYQSWFRTVAVFPTALTDTEAILLTTTGSGV
jgi:hypothetical protein